MQEDKGRTYESRLVLSGELIDAREHGLVFSFTTKKAGGVISSYVFELNGFWQADKNNRLTFAVKRECGACDTLTFQGAWDINKNNQLTYTYEKADLLTKSKKVHTLAFEGHWDIRDKARVSYVIGGSTESAFDFKTNVGILRKNYVQYELGIWLKGRTREIKRSLVLYGTWNIRAGSGLSFKAAYAGGKIYSVSFGAFAKLNRDGTVAFRLLKERKRPLGLALTLSQEILKGDGEAFLKILKQGPEAGIYIGVGGRW
ncbi:MAG: hypothetical protein PHS37_01670 [Candidatus Omnitrophica bacterium]|nr:hypothetical protein [Candidatus Omnitrophota bacterium]